MASKNQVTLTFAGDTDKLEKAFDNVGAAADGMESKVDSASRDMTSSFDKAGEGLDGLDDKAGGLEATTRGTMDVMSGFAALSEGDVLQGVTDLGGGVSSLAQGLGAVLVPTLQKTIGWLAQTRVGMLAQAAAAKVVTAGQWLLNLAMAANPILLVVLAIVALVAIFVIAYKKSETFRNIVQGAFRAVASAIGWVGDRFADLPGRIGRAFSRVGEVISAPFRAGFDAVRRFWNSTIGGKGFSVPGWVPVVGGKSFNFPRFHSGGLVPGAPGQEVMAILQAGERVTPAGAATARGIGPDDLPTGTGMDAVFIAWLQGVMRRTGTRLVADG